MDKAELCLCTSSMLDTGITTFKKTLLSCNTLKKKSLIKQLCLEAGRNSLCELKSGTKTLMKAAAKNGDGNFTRYGMWSSKANSRGNEPEKAAGVALVTSVRLYSMCWLRYLGFFQQHGWVETHMALGNKEFSMIQHFLLQGTGERCSRETRRNAHAHEEKRGRFSVPGALWTTWQQ